MVAISVILDELSELAHFLVFIRVEIKALLSSCTKLRQVIIKRLLGNANFVSGCF